MENKEATQPFNSFKELEEAIEDALYEYPDFSLEWLLGDEVYEGMDWE